MLIVANYKMNLTRKEYKIILNKLNNIEHKDTDLVLCPPFVYLADFKTLKNADLGVQDLSCAKVGKHTGQISATMLKDFGVRYAIAGHSERRDFETNEEVALKVKSAVENQIVPIICVGEKNKGNAEEIITEQVTSALAKVEKGDSLIFAYEPVWAIGSGEIPTNAYINKQVGIIKRVCKKYGFSTPILYGGSVDENNVEKLKKSKVNGFLLGGVCLNVDRFIELLRRV